MIIFIYKYIYFHFLIKIENSFVAKEKPLIDAFNSELVSLTESGITENIRKKYIQSQAVCKEKNEQINFEKSNY